SPPDISFDGLPARLQTLLRSVWTDDTTDPAMLRLGLRFRFPPATQRVRDLATAASSSTDVRLQALRNLAELGGDSAIDSLLPILKDSQATEQIRLAAIDGLQRFRDARIRTALLELYPASPGPLQQRTAKALLSRPEWAAAFLHEFLADRFPVKN